MCMVYCSVCVVGIDFEMVCDVYCIRMWLESVVLCEFFVW